MQFYAGAKFGRLTLRQRLRLNPRISPTIRKQWLADCECGTRVTVPEYYLVRRPNPKENCGQCPDLKTTKTKYNKEFRIWLMMLRRTTNPSHRSYKDYGGRGIKVCEEWSDLVTGFDAFLQHIGPRPSERHSVDRIDNDKGYEPNNVRWATPKEQAWNTRRKQRHANRLRAEAPSESDSDEQDHRPTGGDNVPSV